jgi:hypothetical protein
MNTRSTLPCVMLLLAAGVVVPGCGKKEEAAPAPAPVAAKVVDPMEGIDLNAKVQWPDKYRASSAAQAQAIAALANAIASGDGEKAKGVLETADRDLLADMMALGEWSSQTGGVEAVRVCVLKESDDKTHVTLGLGVQDSLGAYMIAWKAPASGDAVTFTGMAIQPVTAASVAMLDDAELKAPMVAEAVKETKIASSANPADIAAKEAGGGSPGSEAPVNRPFSKPSGE